MKLRVALSIAIVICAVVLHASYVSYLGNREKGQKIWTPRNSSHAPSMAGGAESPVLSILRRSFSAEADRVAHALKVSLAGAGFSELDKPAGMTTLDVLNSQYRRNISIRTLVLTPNSLVRSAHPSRRAVLLSPLSDGIVDVVSHCRRQVQHTRKDEHSLPACDDVDVMRCVGTSEAVSEIEHARWAHREREDADTYVDIPLSPRHPKVSTLALRSVFPEALPLIFNLPIPDNTSTAGDDCDAFTDVLFEAYSKPMRPLEQQIDYLRQRLLVIAGFPIDIDKRIKTLPNVHISPSDLLDAAERIAQIS